MKAIPLLLVTLVACADEPAPDESVEMSTLTLAQKRPITDVIKQRAAARMGKVTLDKMWGRTRVALDNLFVDYE